MGKRSSGVLRAVRIGYTLAMAGVALNTANLTLHSTTSDQHDIASMLGFADWIGWGLYACAALMVPLAASNVSNRFHRWRRAAAYLACAGAMAAALVYIGCVYAGRHTDLDQVRLAYLFNALICMWFAVTVAATVNDPMRRAAQVAGVDFSESNRVPLGDAHESSDVASR